MKISRLDFNLAQCGSWEEAMGLKNKICLVMLRVIWKLLSNMFKRRCMAYGGSDNRGWNSMCNLIFKEGFKEVGGSSPNRTENEPLLNHIIFDSICLAFEVDSGACMSVADNQTYVSTLCTFP